MIESIEWLRAFIFHYPALEYISIFFVAGFWGELGIIALGFLYAHGVVSVFPFLLLSFFGVFFSDAFWFFLGRTTIFNKITSQRHVNATISIIIQAVNRVSKGNNFLTLIVAKFIFGTRVLLIMSIGKGDMEFRKFMYYDAVAVFVWLVVVIPIGLVLGFGFSYLAGILENLYLAIGFVLLFMILMITLQLWFKKILTEKKELI